MRFENMSVTVCDTDDDRASDYLRYQRLIEAFRGLNVEEEEYDEATAVRLLLGLKRTLY
jgi:hypothetical protein